MIVDLVTAPTSEPIALATVKAWLRQDSSDDDTLITSLITAGRQAVEHYTGRALLNQTWDLWMDTFDDIEVPKAPLSSVTSITYTDTAGASQTLAATVYDVFTYTDHPGFIRLAYNQSWPSVRDVADAVKIRFVAGYGAGGSPIDGGVPQDLLHGILLYIAEYYENRELTIAGTIVAPLPQAAERLLWPYRVMTF